MSILQALIGSYGGSGGSAGPAPLAFVTHYKDLRDGENAQVNISPDVQAGDLLLCMEHADGTSSNSSVPGNQPSGFTEIGASQANAVWQRLSYKIASGSESNVRAGLTGGTNSAIHVLILRSAGGVASVTEGQVVTENHPTDMPSSQSLTSSNSTADATVIFAAAGVKNNSVNFTAGSNLAGEFTSVNTSVSLWRLASGYAVYNGSPQDHVFQYVLPGSYSRPTAISCYLDVTLA